MASLHEEEEEEEQKTHPRGGSQRSVSRKSRSQDVGQASQEGIKSRLRTPRPRKAKQGG